MIHLPKAKTKVEQSRLAWFDAWRGLAILAILLFHFGLDTGHQIPVDQSFLLQSLLHPGRWWDWLAMTGYQGVHLFIVLSGAALMYTTKKEKLWAFWRRHAERIVIPYWLALTVMMLTLLGLAFLRSIGHGTDVRHEFFFGAWQSSIPLQLTWGTFWAAITIIPRIIVPSLYGVPPASGWFIGLMVQLYLLFLVMRKWLKKWGQLHFLVGMLLLTVMLRSIILLALPYASALNLLNILAPARVFEFAFGMVLGLYLQRLPRMSLRYLWPLWASLWVMGSILNRGAGMIISSSLIAVGATFASLPLALWLQRLSWLRWFGRYSLVLFLVNDTVRFIFRSTPVVGTWVSQWPWGFIPFVMAVAAVGYGLQVLLNRVFKTE